MCKTTRLFLIGFLLPVCSSMTAADEKRETLLRKIDGMLEKAMKAYNANDAVAFHADFVKRIRGSSDLKDNFALFFHDENKEKFGKFISSSRIDEECIIIEDQVAAHYMAVFEKNKKVRIMAALKIEDGSPKFKLIQVFEDK